MPNPTKRDIQLADLLVAQGILPREAVEACVAELKQKARDGGEPPSSLGEMLLTKGLLTQQQLEDTIQAVPKHADITQAKKDSSNQVGRYTRLEKLGEGAMGEVWKGWDVELRRWVALKFLKNPDADVVAAFKREAQTAAKLNHPNIAAIYEVADHDGVPFIAMQFVEGQTLQTFPRDVRRVLVERVRDAARAVHAANEAGVVHRDLKPANIMVEGRDHRVFILDFGLAKQTTVDAGISASGAIVGTPAYMCPEQARGERADATSDVYGLGAVLYELLSDRPPFQGETIYDVLRKVMDEDPRPLRQRDPRISAELETIVMKCLEKSRDRRYATAGDLADDLDRYLEGEAIHAHPPSVLYRLHKFLRKRKTAAALAVATIAALAVLVPTWLAKSEAEDALMLWGRISDAFGQAEIAARDGEVDRARAILEKGIRLCRKHLDQSETAHGRYFLGRLLRAQGRRREAEEELTIALRLNPRLHEARFERGLIRISRFADNMFAVGLKESDDPERRRRMLKVRYPDLDSLRMEAVKDLDVEVGDSTYFRKVDRWFGKAELARVTGKREEAIALLDRVLTEAPSHVRALLTRGRMAATNGEIDEAYRLATRASEFHRGSPRVLFLRGWCRYYQAQSSPRLEDRVRLLEEAIRDVDAAVGFARDQDADRYELGQLLWLVAEAESNLDRDSRQRYRDAVEEYTRAIREHPDRFWGYNGRSNALSGLGLAEMRHGGPAEDKFERAIDDLNRCRQLDPEFEHFWYNRGNAHLGLGTTRTLRGRDGFPLLNAAVRDYTEALKANPGNERALINRANALSLMGEHAPPGTDVRERFREAIRDYDRARELGCRQPGLSYNRGKTHGLFGNHLMMLGRDPMPSYRIAIQDLSQATREDPTYAPSFQALGKTCVDVGRHRANQGGDGGPDYKRACEMYSHVLKLQPGFPLALEGRGLAQYLRGQTATDPEKALPHFRNAASDLNQALEANPDSSKAHSYLGQTHLSLGSIARTRGENSAGHFSKALQHHNRAVELNPDPVSYANRANLHYVVGNTNEAIRDYSKSIELNPNVLAAVLNRGKLHYENGQGAEKENRDPRAHFDAAIRDLTAALKLLPDHQRALYFRGCAYWRRGQAEYVRAGDPEEDYRKSISDFSRMIRLSPKYPDPWSNRGYVYMLLGEFEKAEADWIEFARLRPDLKEKVQVWIEKARRKEKP